MRCQLIEPHELRPTSACSPSRSLTLASLPQGLVLPRPGGSRNKRPHQSKRPGRLKITKTRKNSQKLAKNGANAPGRLDFCLFIEKRPGALFFALFREEDPVGRAHETRRCAKWACCRSGKGRFAACSGRNSMSIFFLFIFIHQFKLFFFFFCVSNSGLNTIRPTIFFFLETSRGALSTLFLF